MTTWTPDTCGCVIEFSDDGQFRHVASPKLCPKHSAQQGQAHLDTVLAHNQQRNKVFAFVLVTQGVARGDLSGLNIEVKYDPSDVLVVTGLPANSPVTQAVLDTKFGVGKVRIA